MMTLRSQLGRDDPDLTPEHDKAMLRVEQKFEDEWVDKLIDRHHGEGDRPQWWQLHTSNKTRSFCHRDVVEATKMFPTLERGRFHSLTWEYSLDHGLFLDFVIKIRQAVPYNDYGQDWRLVDRDFLFGFEVKPKIWSIGQTLRQLKTYRQNFDGRLYLIAPHNEDLRRIVTDEGFEFFALPELT